MTGLRLDSIDSHGHVEVRVCDVDDEEGLFHESYTGSITVGFKNSGGHVSRDRFEVFLPVSNNAIRDYDTSRFQAAAMVSLAGVQATEDEEFVGVVDGFQIGLRPSSSGGSAQNLVLTVDLAVLNGVIHRVAYNVTVVIVGSFTSTGCFWRRQSLTRDDADASASPPSQAFGRDSDRLVM